MSVRRDCMRPVSVAVWGLALVVCSFGVPPAVAQFTNNLNDMCANGPNKYFCDSSCDTYYYCNGKAKGTSLDCPPGTVCNKLGPHDKYAKTDDGVVGDNKFTDLSTTTYACEEVSASHYTPSCWSQGAAGLCESKTCSGGGMCRSPTPDCAANPNAQSCASDTDSGQCQCSSAQTALDPTYTTNSTLAAAEGIECSIAQPIAREQCDPPLDVMFVMDSSLSIQIGDGSGDRGEYMRARQFVKKFMSYFKMGDGVVQAGYITFDDNAWLTSESGEQKIANQIACPAGMTPPDQCGPTSACPCEISIMATTLGFDQPGKAAVDSDLDGIITGNPSILARSIDMRYSAGGTKMFIGMSIGRMILNKVRTPGREQVMVFTTDGNDQYATEMLQQATALKNDGVRVITVAAGNVYTQALGGSASATQQAKAQQALDDLRKASSSCICTKADGTSCTSPDCVATATCTGDCYRATNYGRLIDEVVIKIVKENCEKVVSITPPRACTTRRTPLQISGQGFGSIQPAPGLIKIKVGDTLFDGTWISDRSLSFLLPAWQNQYGPSYDWRNPAVEGGTRSVPIKVSIDGGFTFLAESLTAGFFVQYSVCELVDRCEVPQDDRSDTGSQPCWDCPSGLRTLTVKGVRFGNGDAGDQRNDEMVCTFGNIAVRAAWQDSETATCIVPPLNCSVQSGACPAGYDGSNTVPVQFNFSLDNGASWFPLPSHMQTFEYQPCQPKCNYPGSMPPISLILLALLLCFCCWPPLILCIGQKRPEPMPELKTIPAPEPPPELVFTTETVTVTKLVKKVRVPPVKKKKPPKKKPEKKKKWDTVAAGQYIRGGKNLAVGWGKYGEAEHGEEQLDGFSEEEEESESDEEIGALLENIELGFETVEEQVVMPQAPETVVIPEIPAMAQVIMPAEDKDKCKRCLRDWRWKWIICCLLVLALVVVCAMWVIEEDRKFKEEINSRTNTLKDPECTPSSRIISSPAVMPTPLYVL